MFSDGLWHLHRIQCGSLSGISNSQKVTCWVRPVVHLCHCPISDSCRSRCFRGRALNWGCLEWSIPCSLPSLAFTVYASCITIFVLSVEKLFIILNWKLLWHMSIYKSMTLGWFLHIFINYFFRGEVAPNISFLRSVVYIWKSHFLKSLPKTGFTILAPTPFCC